MKLKNREINGLIEFLMKFELSGKQSRMRTRFCKLLAEKSAIIDSEKHELISQFGQKDDNGQLITSVDDNGNSVYNLTDSNGFSREFNILMDEDFYIDETLERKEMLLTVKEIVLNCEFVFKGEEAIRYDNWCLALEEVEYVE